MWIRSSGALGENVYQLTTTVSSHSLIVGHATAIVDTSIAAVSDYLISACEEVIGREDTIDFLLLTHADFDTVGGLPNFRKRYPEAELIAGVQTAQILSDPKKIEEFYKANKELAQVMNYEFSYTEQDWKNALSVTRTLGDGDGIDVGEGVQLRLVATPGFRDDAVCYYVMPDHALACCEAIGGYGGKDLVMNCFATDYQQYLSSLQKLSALEIKVLSFPHSGALTGELVNKFFMDAQTKALEFRKQVAERLQQGELIEEVTAALLADWQTLGIAPRGPFANEQEKALTDMVKAIAKLK